MSGTAEMSEWLKNDSERKREEHCLAVSYWGKRLFLDRFYNLK